MTATQFLILAGVIWLAPHTDPVIARTMGLVLTAVGLIGGLMSVTR
jgi:hypothetical protein